jgi:MFS family permease
MTAAFNSGFPNDIHTYGLLSGIWSSSFALGAFLGPSIAGVLYDLVGFENGTYFEISLHIALGIALVLFVCLERRPSEKFVVNGMSDSTVGFAGRTDAVDPTSAAPVPGAGAKSPIYTINGHHSFRSSHRFGSTYGSFSNSCLGTSLSSMRINSEAKAEARGSPLAVESRI